MSSILCFYHSPCNDGAASAAALEYRLRHSGTLDEEDEIRFVPLTYSNAWDEPFPQTYLENEVRPHSPVHAVYFVDICISPTKFDQLYAWLRETDRLAGGAMPVICIDHHKTALERRDELEEFCTETYIRIGPGLSGATLVWHYFDQRFGERPMPLLLRYVADQDVWEWKLEDSKEINNALNIQDGTVDSMRKELEYSLEREEEWLAARRGEGRAIIAMVDAQVLRAMRNVREVEMERGRLLVVNSTSFNSELGNELCSRHEESPNVVALMYTVQEDWGVRCSVRSIAGGRMTARELAERYGGGGHDHAAGCRFESLEGLRRALEELELERS